MQPNPLGLNGIPIGDPGFTVAVEVDRRLSTMPQDQRTALLESIGARTPHLDRSPLGNARLVFEVPRSGWWESGKIATNIARSLKDAWTIVGVEVCRSDLWVAEPFLDHESDEGSSLPYWCLRVEPFRRATVVIEVEPARTPSGRRCSTRPLLSFVHTPQDARLRRSGAKRPQLIIETRGYAEDGPQSIAKVAHGVSAKWSITRIRSVRGDVYGAETSHVVTHSAIDGRPLMPDWQLVSISGSGRYVVITDPTVNMTGWYVDFTTADGDSRTRPFYLHTVWINESGIANIVGDGLRRTAWTAQIEPGSHLTALRTRDTSFDIDRWDSMAAWLVESMHGQPVGLVTDLGPNNFGPDVEDEDVPVVCIQIQLLRDGVFMVRRSRVVLEQLVPTDHSADGLQLDTWHHDDHFDDCTDGYLFTRDTRLVASTCISWFRDSNGVLTPDELGFDYRFADELPRCF